MTSEAYLAAYDRLLERWPVAVEPIEVTSRFGTTRVNACGPRDAPVIVLVHGGGATSAVWVNNVAALAAEHRVYAVDVLSDGGRSRYDGDRIRDRADLMEWLDSTLDGLRVRSAVFAGHSYGAWICLQYALHAPQRTDRLVLLDPTNCFGRQSVSYALRGIPALLGRAGAFRRFIEWETGGIPVDEGWGTLMAEPPRSRTSLVWPALPKPDALQRLTMPVRVVLGGESKHHDARALAERVSRLVPHADIVLIPQATHHTMPTEDAAIINEVLLSATTCRGA